ncbi:Lrp/AsnC family transcriptional regulator [Pikeienuella piscinae]|uniref:Lrp/AsnC family transcriptional regulator n=1 Tax=Pikeienuella piscinae TaxID=2748098 RepID=A0A7L5BYS0_9RHOB|nr:Lrp/AsnC family transcriptional regulator [Pikeienuella piscinae]QIE55667.1 Lrp/AsnC family transcriptional regulator [Pikeienuella piscinae]
MDSFDVKLLELIQENSRLTADQLSEFVNLSPSACQRRIKRLRDDGVIEAEVAVLSPAAVGRGLMMVVGVTLEREHPDIINGFKESMRAMPEVMQCLYVTGGVDFILIVTAKTMEQYDAFTQRFFFENPNIRRFETSVVMDRVKMRLSVPLDVADFD